MGMKKSAHGSGISCADASKTTGEPRKLAPQLAPPRAPLASGAYTMTWGYHALAPSLRYCCFDIMYAIEPGSIRGNCLLAIAALRRSNIAAFATPARAIFVRNMV